MMSVFLLSFSLHRTRTTPLVFHLHNNRKDNHEYISSVT